MKEERREEAKGQMDPREGRSRDVMRTRRRWAAFLYNAGLFALTLFIPIAIIAGTRARGVDVYYGWIAGILAFLILFAFLIYPAILGRGRLRGK